MESDPSTAPFSSETSDMETSGNEKTSKSSGIPRPSPKSSPVLNRKASTGTAASAGKPGGSSSPKTTGQSFANKDTKRSSVAAMVSQFSTYGTVSSTGAKVSVSKRPSPQPSKKPQTASRAAVLKRFQKRRHQNRTPLVPSLINLESF